MWRNREQSKPPLEMLRWIADADTCEAHAIMWADIDASLALIRAAKRRAR